MEPMATTSEWSEYMSERVSERPGMGNAEYECTVCGKEVEEIHMASGDPAARTGECDACVDKDSIVHLGLAVRTWSVLKRNGVNTTTQLQALSIDDLMRMRNMGRMSINEIGKALDRPDLSI